MDIAHQRLFNQHISQQIFDKPEQVVSRLGGIQAQDYAGAKWALGMRMKSATDDDIEKAFNAGTILRTHMLRPTWHFVTPADIRWMLKLTAPRVHALNAHMYRRLGLDNAVFKRSEAALVKALRGGKQLTRDELRGVLQRTGIETDELQRVTYLMMHAELEGIICSGARRGKQFTYALLDERVPSVKSLDREDALAELSQRYFMSRGPATVQDFAKWSGLTISDARRGLDMVKASLQREDLNGHSYWFPMNPPLVKIKSPTANMLSIYDEYISGYKDRSAIGEDEVGAKLFAMGNALQFIIIIDGQIVGTWKRTLRKDEAVIELNPFRALTKAESKAITAASEKYAAFLGLKAAIA